MSAQIAPAAEHVCYVHCNLCNTVLAVSVPGNSVLTVVTVRCGHCTNLLSVNMRGLMMQSLPAAAQEHLQENIKPPHGINGTSRDQFGHLEFGSSSSSKQLHLPMMYSAQNDHLQLLQEQALAAARPPEKRQRVPSAYNRFIKEEIRRIKANNPDISHREAFSTAAKNWAHYPNIHFGREGGSKKLVDEKAVAAAVTTTTTTTSAPTKIQGFY